jgi:hypothetical protein
MSISAISSSAHGLTQANAVQQQDPAKQTEALKSSSEEKALSNSNLCAHGQTVQNCALCASQGTTFSIVA